MAVPASVPSEVAETFRGLSEKTDITFLTFKGKPTFNATATVRFFKEEGTYSQGQGAVAGLAVVTLFDLNDLAFLDLGIVGGQGDGVVVVLKRPGGVRQVQ